MDVSQVSVSTTAVTTAVRQLQTINEAQMAIMKNISDSQQQMAQILQAAGIGQNLDAQA